MLDRGEVLQLRMAALTVVEDFDVFKNGVREIEFCPLFLPIQKLDLRARSKRYLSMTVATITDRAE